MYIPKKHDWLGPVAVILGNFFINQRVIDAYGKSSWDLYVIVYFPATFVSICWSIYLWRAGEMYQAWVTGSRTEQDERQRERDRQAEARAWAMNNQHIITSGNTPVVVPVADKQRIHPAMEEYQYVTTAPALNEHRVRMYLKRLCKRQIVYRNHPELGYPQGDYREKTWVQSGEFTRKALTVCLGILEHAGGIGRASAARNATYITRDWRVIEMGKDGTALPHPPGCECDEHIAP